MKNQKIIKICEDKFIRGSNALLKLKTYEKRICEECGCSFEVEKIGN